MVKERSGIDELAFASAHDEFGLAENLQMLRDRRGRDPAHRDDLATVHTKMPQHSIRTDSASAFSSSATRLRIFEAISATEFGRQAQEVGQFFDGQGFLLGAQLFCKGHRAQCLQRGGSVKRSAQIGTLPHRYLLI